MYKTFVGENDFIDKWKKIDDCKVSGGLIIQ